MFRHLFTSRFRLQYHSLVPSFHPSPKMIVAVEFTYPFETKGDVGYLWAFLDTGADKTIICERALDKICAQVYNKIVYGKANSLFFPKAHTPNLSPTLDFKLYFNQKRNYQLKDIEIYQETDFPGDDNEDLIVGRDILNQIKFTYHGRKEFFKLHL